MDKQLKSKWVNALRSGEYNQGAAQLKTSNGSFCCLGVLCDISGVTKWDGSWAVYHNTYGDEVEVETELSEYLLNVFGFTYDDQNNLINMNDGYNFSFDKIADWIDTNL